MELKKWAQEALLKRPGTRFQDGPIKLALCVFTPPPPPLPASNSDWEAGDPWNCVHTFMFASIRLDNWKRGTPSSPPKGGMFCKAFTFENVLNVF